MRAIKEEGECDNGDSGYPRIAYLSYWGMVLVLRQYGVQIRKTNTLLPLFLAPPL